MKPFLHHTAFRRLVWAGDSEVLVGHVVTQAAARLSATEPTIQTERLIRGRMRETVYQDMPEILQNLLAIIRHNASPQENDTADQLIARATAIMHDGWSASENGPSEATVVPMRGRPRDAEPERG